MRVSGNATQAIKIFLNRMLDQSSKIRFGIEKTPPELTIYKAYVEDQYLHQKIKSDISSFNIQIASQMHLRACGRSYSTNDRYR